MAFKEFARESGLRSYSLWKEEPLDDEVRNRLDGDLASEPLLLDHKSPVSARTGLAQLLLLAPTIVVADPIWAWVEALDSNGTWGYGGAWYKDATPPSDALVQVLSGLIPLRHAIREGVVRLLRPPAETTVEMNRLFVNPTTHSMLQEAFPGWGLKQDKLGNDIPDSHNDFTLMSNLDYYFNAEERWEAMANTIFPGPNLPDGVRRLRRAIAFDDYTALNASPRRPRRLSKTSSASSLVMHPRRLSRSASTFPPCI